MQQDLFSKIRLGDNADVKLANNATKYDYSKYSSLEDFDWDVELEQKFSPIAQKLNLSQESIEMLLEIALEMSRKQKALYEQDAKVKLDNDILNYTKLFNEDNELPSLNSVQVREYMEIANSAYSDFASPKLKEILEKTGLVYHPELIKMFHKIGELSREDNISHYGKPSIEELTPAQILYGTK